MKTVYSKPMVEKIEFDYQTVIATSGCFNETTFTDTIIQELGHNPCETRQKTDTEKYGNV